ncbi:MAG: PQQ-binding-like beta-propeller repeat protein, partial [Candidatus Rifleibacteriota bacterium]
ILASFKTGEMMTLAIENGRVIYRGRNDAFSFKTAPVFKDLTAEFLTDEGFYFIVEVDGAKILHSENLLPRKLDFLPFVTAIEHGIVAHKGEALKVEDRKVKTLLNLSNRVFVTKPVFDDKLMYIGTQDGWIYCVHHGSQDEKWKIHVNGELEEDSLHIAGSQLLVKTRAGSIISIDRRFI